MSTYPRERIEFLQWCEAHWPIWAKDPSQIGLTVDQVNAVKNATIAMRGRVTDQTAARAAAKSATEAVVESESATRDVAADAVRFIRAFAISTNDPNVYNLAQIPAPGSAAPLPPPGTPTDFKVELNAEGSITIRWKAAHPEGSYNVVYFVQRKLLTETQFRIIGGSGERAYTDDTLPFGVDGATYIVTSQRGSVQSAPSRQLTITFGSGGGRGNGVQFSENSGRAAA
jgi:hypothetical protein